MQARRARQPQSANQVSARLIAATAGPAAPAAAAGLCRGAGAAYSGVADGKLGARPMSEGYSGTPLLQKLGIRPGQRALLIAVPGTVGEIESYAGFDERVEVAGLAARELVAACAQGPFDYIHVFETEAALLEAEIDLLRRSLVANGMLWVSWPKRSARVATSLSEDVIRAIALDNGLVDVKVCAVNQVWSGLKLVIPVALRPTA